MNIIKKWNITKNDFDVNKTYTYPKECTDEDFNDTEFNRNFKN